MKKRIDSRQQHDLQLALVHQTLEQVELPRVRIEVVYLIAEVAKTHDTSFGRIVCQLLRMQSADRKLNAIDPGNVRRRLDVGSLRGRTTQHQDDLVTFEY